jgi:3'-phosphoadenosine 5'-phosphosulfate sulfotransferase (PAPS reductase)/FAD synthetase
MTSDKANHSAVSMSERSHPAYRIEGPALVSFSGGRTSAYMLHEILRAHDGKLPEDVVVAFANTGKEREETLRFVHECGSQWGVRVHWLERVADGGFVEVGFNSVSRKGEPFEALITKRSYTPNAVTRFCTSELKVRVMRDFCLSLGWTAWSNVVGLRYDEGHRVLKMLARNESGKERWQSLMPLAKAKVTKRDVLAFWSAQPFDLGLRDYEGNCDLCFLKSRGKLEQIIRDDPSRAEWWSRMETVGKGRFVTEYSFADLARHVARSPVMPGIIDDEEYDAECGLTCGADEQFLE